MFLRMLIPFLLFCAAVTHAQVREIWDAVKPKKKITGIPVLQKNSQVFSLSISTPNKVSQFLTFGVLGAIFLRPSLLKVQGPL
jgi:hypothetical protein